MCDTFYRPNRAITVQFYFISSSDLVSAVISSDAISAGNRASLVATVPTESVPGHEIVETLGIARGNTVRARNAGRDITQGLRNLAGGALKAY